jgi:glycosyltransferase involved in cell wall biosynthesis
MEELVGIYCEHCFLIVPAYIESLGIAILEAMSCGLIVAAANRGGMTEIIDDGVNGFIFKHPTPKFISDMLIKMMGLSDFEKSSILAESDKTLLFFNSTRMINEVRDLYRDLFNRKI